jgi:hypothetical protein
LRDEEVIQNFYSLKDFYSLIYTLIDLLKKKTNRNSVSQKMGEVLDEAIYRNFNGQPESFEFREEYFEKLDEELPNIPHNVLGRVVQSIGEKNRRFVLVVIEDSNSYLSLVHKIRNSNKNVKTIYASPFIKDSSNDEVCS